MHEHPTIARAGDKESVFVNGKHGVDLRQNRFYKQDVVVAGRPAAEPAFAVFRAFSELLAALVATGLIT
jgi:hypothetical protein